MLVGTRQRRRDSGGYAVLSDRGFRQERIGDHAAIIPPSDPPTDGGVLLQMPFDSEYIRGLDLERFASFNIAKMRPEVWQLVIGQLREEEMPPDDARQPTAAQLER